MSASNEKKKVNSGSKVKLSPPKKKENEKSELMYKVAAVAIVVALLFGIGIAVFRNFVSTDRVAITVAGEEIKAGELNFYYMNSYQNLVNMYGDYTQYLLGLDPSVPLKSQQYMLGDEYATWHDYFKDSAVKTAQRVHMLCSEAAAAGVGISADDAASIVEQIEGLRTEVLGENPNITLDYYLEYVYGKGMDEVAYTKLLTNNFIAQSYSAEISGSFSYTDANLESYYGENKDNFDVVDYRMFTFNATTTDEMSDAEKSAAISSAHSLAEIMANAVTDDDSFVSQALANAAEDQKEIFGDAKATLNTAKAKTSVSPTEVADWLFSTDRAVNEVTVIDGASGSYVVMFKARYRNDYNTVNVRHILASFVVDEGAEAPTAAQEAAAKALAEEWLAAYEDGDKTEESFAELAKEHTDDGNGDVGGIYENVYKGQMVPEFEAWIYDSSRKPGDTGIVKTDYGYHVMYYSGQSTSYWKVQVENTLRSEDYQNYETERLLGYPVKEKVLGMMGVGLQH